MADCQDSLATEEAGGAGGQLQRHAGDQGARQVSLKGQLEETLQEIKELARSA